MEVLVILSVLSILVASCIPALDASKRKAQRIYCVNNLAQIGLGHRVWAGDNFDQYPLWATVTNNGSVDLLRKGIPDSQLALWNFEVMSNELSTPDLLHCPADDHTTPATSFTNKVGNGNISFFVNLDASADQPQMILVGDANLAIGGAPVSPGLLCVPTNALVSWTDERHYRSGNIGLADGSVSQFTNLGLLSTLAASDVATNRFAIP